MSFYFIYLSLVLALSHGERDWHGLVPLHSTRADVERVLGLSTDSCKCIYKTKDEVVYIEYSVGSCKENETGWNTPSDTVITIRVAPKIRRPILSFNIDESQYKRTKDLHTQWVYYTNAKEGITFEVAEDGTVGGINYFPKEKDIYLRCPTHK